MVQQHGGTRAAAAAAACTIVLFRVGKCNNNQNQIWWRKNKGIPWCFGSIAGSDYTTAP